MAEMMMVKYESANGEITLTADDVKKYLVQGWRHNHGLGIKTFHGALQISKVKPFTNECYCIKYKDDFQMVVGYDAYKRRADENPAYIGRQSGIIVQREKEVAHKEGTCPLSR